MHPDLCHAASLHARVRRWLLAAVLCSPLFVAAGLFDDRDDALVKERCAQEGKVTGTPAVVDGLFEAVWPDSEAFHQAAKHVLERRFRYVEYERRQWDPNTRPPGARFQYHHFHEDLLGPETGEKYVRISVAREGDARCEPFKQFVTSSFIEAHQLRWWGLPHGMCLALERTNELKAPVEHVYVSDAKAARSGQPRRGWFRYQERDSGRVIAEVWTGAGRGFSCLDPAEQRKLDTFVLSRGNPDLPDLPPIARAERPQFPSRRIAVAMRAGPESATVPMESPGHLPRLNYANWAFPGQLMDHGDTFISPVYARSEGPIPGRGISVGLAGFHLYVVRPGLRRQMPVADGALNFTSCGPLSRLGGEISINCQSRQELEGGEKWTWSNWLLLYEDDGSPREHIRFDLTRGPFPLEQWRPPMLIRDVRLLADGTLQATVQYQRDEGGTPRDYQVEAIFRLEKAD